MDTMDSMGTDTAKYSNIVGVFRDRTNADHAIEALKQAGIGENTIELTEYNPVGAEEEQGVPLVASGTSEKGDVMSLVESGMSAQRFLVHVRAEGREQEAVAILVSCGPAGAQPNTRLLENLRRVSLERRKRPGIQPISALWISLHLHLTREDFGHLCAVFIRTVGNASRPYVCAFSRNYANNRWYGYSR